MMLEKFGVSAANWRDALDRASEHGPSARPAFAESDTPRYGHSRPPWDSRTSTARNPTSGADSSRDVCATHSVEHLITLSYATTVETIVRFLDPALRGESRALQGLGSSGARARADSGAKIVADDRATIDLAAQIHDHHVVELQLLDDPRVLPTDLATSFGCACSLDRLVVIRALG